MSEAFLRLKDVSLTYGRGGNQRRRLLKFGQRIDEVATQALSNISLSISAGESVALIGSNGAGKTTLLRVLAGIFPPTLGSREARGNVRALIDAGYGLDPDFTGRQNAVHRARIEDLGRREAEAFARSVGKIAQIGESFDRFVRTYSNGMTAR